jgi:hypothetical protein
MRSRNIALFVAAALLLVFACKPMQESTERGQRAIEDAKKLQQDSTRFQKPTPPVAERAIRAFESGRTEIQSIAVTSITPQDEFDKYIVKANVNNEERTYGLEKDAAGAWVATPPPS